MKESSNTVVKETLQYVIAWKTLCKTPLFINNILKQL